MQKKSTGGKRRTRWQAFGKLSVKTRAGITAILVIGLSVMAMLIAGRDRNRHVARNDLPNATRAMARSADVVPAIPTRRERPDRRPSPLRLRR